MRCVPQGESTIPLHLPLTVQTCRSLFCTSTFSFLPHPLHAKRMYQCQLVNYFHMTGNIKLENNNKYQNKIGMKIYLQI